VMCGCKTAQPCEIHTYRQTTTANTIGPLNDYPLGLTITPSPDVSGDELLPCPFCGGAAEIEEHTYWTGQRNNITAVSVKHRCADRSSMEFRRTTGREAAAAWNARRNPQQTDEAIRSMAQRIAAELSHDYLRDFGIGITAVVADRIADVLRGEK
jgi:hypothetical protein